MTDMTRRNFLKSAGVMALAVAAAGVLSGCDSSKNPVMADVTVKYEKYNSLLGKYEQIGNDGEYDETVQVVKGQKSIEKDKLKNLSEVCNFTGYSMEKAPETIDIDWTTETPIAKVQLSQF